jgi:signal transduction histidine kinase
MDLDTKWKSVRESRWFKALCVVLSMVLAFSSVALLSAVMRVSGLYGDDAFTDPSVAKKGSLVQTTIFKAELDVIVNDIALLAGQKQLQQKVAALKKAKADSVAAALEQYKKDQATAIRKTLVFYAGLKNQNITNIGKDIPNYKVPAKTIKKVVAEDRDAPGLIRDLQQIVNGTRAGEDYLPYLQLANWLRSSDGVEYYSDMSEEPDYLIRFYTVAFTVDGQTVEANEYDADQTLSDTVKSAETHIKKLYDKAVVEPYQYSAARQQEMRRDLQELQCLQFYAKDNITGQVVSQLPEGQTPAMLKNAPVYYSKTKARENLRGTDYGADNARSDAVQYLMDGDMSIYVGIEPTVAGGNDMLPDFVELNALCTRMQNMNTVAMTVAAVCLAVLALAFLVLACLGCGRRAGTDGVRLLWMDYIPLELHTAIIAAAVLGLGYLLFEGLFTDLFHYYGYQMSTLNFGWLFLAACGAFGAVAWGLYAELTLSFVRLCKSEKHLYKGTLLYYICLGIWRLLCKLHRFNRRVIRGLAYTPRHFKRNMVFCAVGYLLINIVLAVLFGAFLEFAPISVPCALAFLAFNGFCVGYALRFLFQLDRVIEAAANRTDVEAAHLHPALAAMAGSLRYTNQELHNAVDQAVRDERLKTELITNVSHDLKTPITSIITYTDLLSKCPQSDEKAKEYMAVLTEKSTKLARLVEDLIEASKLSSGNITLHPMVLDLGELTAQAIGEYQKEFEENRLQLVLDPDLPRVQAFADGSKTYRVLENLLQNAKKYSAADSRVYVRVYKQGDFGVFEIKNISAEPLNISPQELTQRFVRGDASRTKEGNGLGLSIAQELCSAQQGKLELLIDGDLFKARVYLPQPKNALPQDTAE